MRTLVPRLRHHPWVSAVPAGFSAVGLLLAALVAAPVSSAAADSGCRVDYAVNQWSGGYTAAIKVTNLGPAVTSWRLTWTYGGDQQVTSAWNAGVAQSGKAVTVTDAGWNGALATGVPRTSGSRARTRRRTPRRATSR